MQRTIPFLVFIIALSLISCSRDGSTPVSPGAGNQNLSGDSTGRSHWNENTRLWGLWQVSIDAGSGKVEIIPLRGAAFTCNVNQFVDAPPGNLSTEIDSVDVLSEYTDISVSVGLRHPFPGLPRYTGFDVLGVFMGNGSAVFPGSSGLQIGNESDQQLLNPDGFTRWFNMPEFQTAGNERPLLGYDPGKAGTPGYDPTAEINPYKYFADDLDKDDNALDFIRNNSAQRGCFRPGHVNYRRYDLRFPNSTGTVFQYAVIAHWEPPSGDGENLSDFPETANVDEAVLIDVEDSSRIYNNPGDYGDVILDIGVWDWSAECNLSGSMEEYVVVCCSSAWTGGVAADQTPVEQDGQYKKYHVEIPVEELSSDDPLPVWIAITYPDMDYSNRFGISNDAEGELCGYSRTEIPVQPSMIEVSAPNGGEVLYVGYFYSIEWSSFGVNGNVKIEYSKDDFQSDVRVIAADEANDGSFLWDPIPNDPADTCKVRVTSLDDPSVVDDSDDYFTIDEQTGWAIQIGGEQDDVGVRVCWDPAGYVYVTGEYMGTVDFDPGSGASQYTSNGAGDAFLCKFTDTGEFVWARAWGGDGWDGGNGIGVDSSGNVFVTGRFESTVDFDPDPAETDTRYCSGWHDGYLIKFDSDGDFISVVTWGGSGPDYSMDLVIDSDDRIYVMGHFLGDVDFDPDPVDTDMHASAGGRDIALCKFDSDLDFIWARTWGGPGYWDIGHGVDVDNAGNVYASGDFMETADFNPDDGMTYNLTAVGDRDAFVSKLTADGDFVWAGAWGGSGLDVAEKVKYVGETSICVVGTFEDVVDFDPGPGENIKMSNGGEDVFLNILDSSGSLQNALTWGSTGRDDGLYCSSDLLGNVYVTGWFAGLTDFDPSESGSYEIDPVGERDSFISSFDSNGLFNWVYTTGGPGPAVDNDGGHGLCTDSSGFIYCTGAFHGTADFMPGDGEYDLTAGGGNDGYLMRIRDDGYW